MRTPGWNRVQWMERAVVLLAGLMVLFAFDLYFRSEQTPGRVIGESRHVQFITTSFGSQEYKNEMRTVEYFVQGKSWTMTLRTRYDGKQISLRYYRPWPRIVWVGNRAVAPLLVGLGATFFLGFVAAFHWIRRIRMSSDMGRE